MKRYRLVIFDFDGTLADTFSWFVRKMDSVADHFGLERVAPKDVEALRGHSARQIIEKLRIPMWKVPLIARHIRRLARKERDHVRLFDGIDRLIESLSGNGVTLAIVSSNAEQVVREALGEATAQHVRHFACGASLFGKAGLFRKVVARARLPREETICIGDEIRDAEAARAVGLAFGAVAWGFNHVEALLAQKPDALFYQVDDILNALNPSGLGQRAGAAGLDLWAEDESALGIDLTGSLRSA